MPDIKKPKELASLGGDESFGAPDPKSDVIDGWNWKTDQALAPEIDGLLPFVQLIGLYNEEEINRLVSNDLNWDDDARRVVFVEEDGDEQDLNSVSIEQSGADARVQTNIAEEQKRYFDEKLRTKFMGVHLTDATHGNESTATPGIILATNTPQAGNKAYEYYEESGLPKDAGGLGITDLQIETGTKDFMNRRYKLRLTVTDPQALNDEPQYLKLTTLQSQFLIIHGWANPQEIHGWPGLEPPRVEPPTPEWPHGTMTVDLTQEDTAGAWGAAVIALTMFDFAFNEVGQLEASFTFMPREISFLATYRVPVIAETTKRMLNSGEKQTPTNAADPGSAPNIFAGFSTGLLSVAGEFGKNMADVIREEQANYTKTNPAIKGLFDRLEDDVGLNALNTMREWADRATEWSGNTSSLIEKQKEQEGRYRFPYAGPGIRIYEEVSRSVADPTSLTEPDPDADPPTGMIRIKEHKTRLAYYYLGWIMEAVRFSLWDLNKNKVRRGETPFNVRFRYMPISPESNSNFNLAFQETLRSGLIPDVKSYIQESTKFLKANCFPGLKLYNPLREEFDVGSDRVNMRPMTRYDIEEGLPAALGIAADQYGLMIKVARGGSNEQISVHESLPDLGRDDRTMEIPFRYMIIGTLGEGEFAPNIWDIKTREEKIAFIPYGDWRASLVVDEQEGQSLRIMHPDYEYQLFYTWQAVIGGTVSGGGSDAVPEYQQSAILENQRMYLNMSSGASKNTAVIGDQLRNTYTTRFGERIVIDQDRRQQALTAAEMTVGHGKPNEEGWLLHPVSYYRSRYNNFFIGDISETREYGVLMPAVSARYYSGDYVATQRRWYNKHREYMVELFQNILKERIETAMAAGETIVDIADEPVDLFWLTGRKYHLSSGANWLRSGNKGFEADNNSYWDGPQARIQAQSTYTLQELRRKGKKLEIARSGALLGDIDEKLRLATAELESLPAAADVLGRPNRRGIYDGMQEIDTAAAQLQYVDNNRSTSLRTLRNAEDSFARVERSFRGLNGELDFWNLRLSRVLSTLYNQDIIDFAPQSATDLDTHAARLTISITEGNSGPINQGAGLGRKILSADGNDQISAFSNPTKENAYQAIFYDAEGQEWVGGSSIGINFQEDWYSRGIRRYVVTRFEEAVIPLTIENVDRIGYMGFGEGDIADPARGRRQDLWPWRSYLQYMFMATMPPIVPMQINNMLSNIPIWYSDRYLNGEALFRAGQDDTGIMQSLRNARNALWDYITRQRQLIRRYLEKIAAVNGEIDGYSNTVGYMINKIDKIQQKKIDLERNIASFDNITAFSPFASTSPFAEPIKLDKGGGRFVELDSLVAQQYEQRFSKVEVDGVNDIQNYGPPAGGKAYFDNEERKWGWQSNLNEEQVSEHRAAQEKAVRDINAKPNYGDWDGPKSILNFEALLNTLTYSWSPSEDVEPITYPVRSSTPNAGQPARTPWGVPADGLILENKANKDEVRLVNGITVLDLVRAGFADGDLIRQILLYRYGWKDIEFEGMSDETLEDNNAPFKIIKGFWPSKRYFSFNDWQRFAEAGGSPEGTTMIKEPLRYVDQDLDFVEPAYRQGLAPVSFTNAGIEELAYLRSADWKNPDDMNTWIKIPVSRAIFTPIAEKNSVMYPNSKGWRIGFSGHIPVLPEAAVQQLVNQNRESISKVEVGGYANNPDWAEVPAEISATKEKFQFSNKPSVSDQYPFGIPAGAPGREDHKGPLNPDTRDQEPGWEIYVGGFLEGTDENKARGSFVKGWNGTNNNNQYTNVDENVLMSAPTIHGILDSLPPEFERGFFTSVRKANANFSGGEPLNIPLAEFIYKHLIYLLPQGRRVGHHSELEEPAGDSLQQYTRRVRDVTYGDLFDDLVAKTSTMADFSNQSIQNVAEIPIKREVVDNLLSRRNSNMSLLQFFSQVMSPSSIGLDGNVQIGTRNVNGVVEMFAASISYKGRTTDIFKSMASADTTGNVSGDFLGFDYKRRNSLIQSIDMSSKMDPAAFLTYQNSSDLLKGRDYNVLKLLSYEGVAEDFKEFLDGTSNTDNAGETYSGIITIGSGDKIRIDKAKFNELPSGVLDSFISQDPERWAKITAMMQGNNNFTTELLAFYMRSVTLIIHGMTNLQPFNLISVSGVLPALEGIYIITNLTEKITPTDFQTIIEGKLLKRKRLVADGPDVFI